MTVNGLFPGDVLYADEEEGVVMAIRFDDVGKPRLAELRGRVVIEEIPHYCRKN